MKQRNPLTKLTLLLAVLLTLGAAQAQADILPRLTINFAPVAITMDQTAGLNLMNIDVPNGILGTWRFIDASGLTLAQSTGTVTMGKISSVDFRRAGGPLPPNTHPANLIRAEVRAQVGIVTPNIPSESLRRSLELFNNKPVGPPWHSSSNRRSSPSPSSMTAAPDYYARRLRS